MKHNLKDLDFQNYEISVWGSELDASLGGEKDSKGLQGYDTFMSFLRWLIDR